MTRKTPPTGASRPRTPPKAPTTPRPSAPARPASDGRPPVTLAVVAGAHGVTGEVRLKVFAEDLSAYRSFNDGALTLLTAREGTNGTIARFAEIADRTAAEALRGTPLTVPRAALPPLGEGEYYHVDLIGLPVEIEEGATVGTVVAVENFGAGDLLDVETEGGRRVLVPVAQAEIGAVARIPAGYLE